MAINECRPLQGEFALNISWNAGGENKSLSLLVPQIQEARAVCRMDSGAFRMRLEAVDVPGACGAFRWRPPTAAFWCWWLWLDLWRGRPQELKHFMPSDFLNGVSASLNVRSRFHAIPKCRTHGSHVMCISLIRPLLATFRKYLRFVGSLC